MVVTSAKPVPRQRVEEFVGRITGEYVSELQAGYLADQSWAVASLAQLRRGAGKLPQDVPELWGMTGAERLFADETLSEAKAAQAETAMFLAVTLYALHQQSQAEPMHRPGVELGEAVRRLMGDEIDEPIRRRLVRVGTAATRDALATRLREIITLLRR
ncbi:MAG: type I-E CRISPR-associated protein Cse2/CasB, partial [Thermobispora sp.]|nr:type I-E CRISPR-associated protein Cse2/CasB [Thermobispora sp.]